MSSTKLFFWVLRQCFILVFDERIEMLLCSQQLVGLTFVFTFDEVEMFNQYIVKCLCQFVEKFYLDTSPLSSCSFIWVCLHVFFFRTICKKAYLRISALNFKANRNLRIVFAQPDTTIISLTDSPEETPSRYRGRRS